MDQRLAFIILVTLIAVHVVTVSANRRDLSDELEKARDAFEDGLETVQDGFSHLISKIKSSDVVQGTLQSIRGLERKIEEHGQKLIDKF